MVTVTPVRSCKQLFRAGCAIDADAGRPEPLYEATPACRLRNSRREVVRRIGETINLIYIEARMKTMRFIYDWIGVVWWLFALLVFLAFCWEYDEPDAASEWYGEGGW